MRALSLQQQDEVDCLIADLKLIPTPQREARWVELHMGEQSLLWRCRSFLKADMISIFTTALYFLKDIEVILGLIRRDPHLFFTDTLRQYDCNSIHPHVIRRLTKDPPHADFNNTLAVQLEYFGDFGGLRTMIESGHLLVGSSIRMERSYNIQVSVLARRNPCRAAAITILSLIQPGSAVRARDTLTLIAKMVWETRCNEKWEHL